MNTKVKSGWIMDRDLFSEVGQSLFKRLVNERRKCFPRSLENMLQGERFVNDDRVFVRLESMFSEEEFIKNPSDGIDRALVNAATSDYWYTFEKVWDDGDLYDEIDYEDFYE